MKRFLPFLIALLAGPAPSQTASPDEAARRARDTRPTSPVQSQQQWVRADQSDTFPPPPAQTAPSQGSGSPEQSQQTGYGGPTYGGSPAMGQNGVAPLPPLTPPSNFTQAEALVSPFSPSEIIQLRKQLDRSRQAKAYKPVRAIPHIGSLSVDLSPGASLPVVRTLPGEMSTLLFVDSTGAPWPLAAPPRVSDSRYFDPEWLKDTATVVISALSFYEDGNLVVMLQGLATPIPVKLVSGEPDSKSKTRVVDYRLDLRVPGRGPNAKAALLGPGKIALYDDTMQKFLDGVPPADARRLEPRGDVPAKTQVWQCDGALFVRTELDIRTAFDQSIASGDGTRVYRLPPTPYVTLSDQGRSVTVQLDIE